MSSRGLPEQEYLGDVIPVEYVMGLTTAKLTRVLIYGEDDEDTETLRLRYQESFNERALPGMQRTIMTKHWE